MPSTPPDVLKSEFLLELKLDVDYPAVAVAPAPAGERKIFTVRGGTFEGPLGRGIVLSGGTDWGLREADELFRLDVRAMLQMEDGATLSVTYRDSVTYVLGTGGLSPRSTQRRRSTAGSHESSALALVRRSSLA